MDNPLNSSIKLRVAVHSGHLAYSESETQYTKADTVKKAITLESKAAVPNSLVVSESLAMSQDQSLLNIFSDSKTVPNSTDKYRIYHVAMEQGSSKQSSSKQVSAKKSSKAKR